MNLNKPGKQTANITEAEFLSVGEAYEATFWPTQVSKWEPLSAPDSHQGRLVSASKAPLHEVSAEWVSLLVFSIQSRAQKRGPVVG